MRSLLLLVVLALACAPPPKPPHTSCACGKRVCGSVCGHSCGACADDGVCSSDGLSCRAALAIGAACTTDSECGNGRVCLAGATRPGGYCTRRCSDSNPCPDGGSCGVDGDGESVCLAVCASSDACRGAEGYACEGGVCPACVGSCDGRSCGDDGCGHSCGVCDLESLVCDAGQCAGDYNRVAGMVDSTQRTDARWDFAALADENGYVFLIGGREVVRDPDGSVYSGGSTKVTRYNPGSRTFDFPAGAKLPSAIAHPHAAMLGGVPFVAGGVDDSDTKGVADTAATGAWKFANQRWNPIAPLPQPSMYGALVNAGETLWLLAGEVNGAPSTRMDSYDATNDRWTDAPARPTARSHFAAASDGQRLYVLGGWDGAKAVATVEIFDPTSGWSTAPDLAMPITDAAAVVAGGRIFLFGGYDGPNQGQLTPVVQTVDLETHRTAVIGTTYDDLIDEAPVLLRSGGVLLFGGMEIDPSLGTYVAHDDVVSFRVPAP